MRQAVKTLKTYLMSFPFLRNLYSLRFDTLDLVYKPEDLNEGYYRRVQQSGDPELEHQIGRLTNYKNILHAISAAMLPGDIIEFGTWKGFSLLWIAYLCEREGMVNKKIVGLDGFVGLPASDGVFKQGMFKDATLAMCCRNLLRNRNLYNVTTKQIFIDKYLFSQNVEILSKLRSIGSKQFVFIHIDCDISSSVREIFQILTEGNLLSDVCYILFDDYGCDSNLKAVADEALSRLSKEWKIEPHSSTRLTQNFKLQRKR